MDLFPLYNSIRIALVSTVITFFLGLAIGYYVSKSAPWVKGVLDCILTLPLVLPPTVVGFFLLGIVGPNSGVGSFLTETFSLHLVMNWKGAVLATVVVTFPLMYRTARASFENYDHTLSDAAATLGLSPTRIFWQVCLPCCKSGLIAGGVLAFARALGEYGATGMICGYIPGHTATISTTVYQLWRTGDEAAAYNWVAVNVVLSLLMLAGLNFAEKTGKGGGAKCR